MAISSTVSLPVLNFPLYKATIPASGGVVSLRPMVQRDEKILLIAKESKEQSDILTAIKQVVQNCIVSSDLLEFDIDALPIIDLEYLFIRLRSISVGNITKVAYIDGEDGETRTFDVDLDKVLVTKFIKEDDIIVNEDVKIELGLPPASLYTDATFLKATGVAVVDALVSSIVKSIRNKSERITRDMMTAEDLQAFLDSLPVPIYEKLTDAIDRIPHLEYTINYKNSRGNDRTITLSSLNDFFTFA